MLAAFLLSSLRTTPSRMTPVTRTAAAVRVTMWIRRLSCWMSLWREQRAQHTPTVRPRHRGPCSGLFALHPASALLAAPHPAHPHLLVSNSHHLSKKDLVCINYHEGESIIAGTFAVQSHFFCFFEMVIFFIILIICYSLSWMTRCYRP